MWPEGTKLINQKDKVWCVGANNISEQEEKTC